MSADDNRYAYQRSATFALTIAIEIRRTSCFIELCRVVIYCEQSAAVSLKSSKTSNLVPEWTQQ